MLKSLASAFALTTLAMLAGCASIDSVDSDVSSYSRWPAGRSPSTYVFERLPSQQAHPKRAQRVEDAARPAIESAGFAPATSAEAADVTIQLGARITELDPSPFDDPLWYGRLGPFPRPLVYGRFGRPFFGPGWGYGYGPASGLPYYDREVAVLIRDRRGEPLYEGRARNEGSSADVPALLAAMFRAALHDFPNGSGPQPHRVRIGPPS